MTKMPLQTRKPALRTRKLQLQTSKTTSQVSKLTSRPSNPESRATNLASQPQIRRCRRQIPRRECQIINRSQKISTLTRSSPRAREPRATAAHALGLGLEDVGERFVDKLRAEERRRAEALDVGVFGQVHADDAALSRERAYEAERLVPAEAARLRRPRLRDERGVEAVYVNRQVDVLRQRRDGVLPPVFAPDNVFRPEDACRKTINRARLVRGDRAYADLYGGQFQILHDARHDRGVRVRRAVIRVAQVCVRVYLKDGKILELLRVSLNHGRAHRMLAADHTHELSRRDEFSRAREQPSHHRFGRRGGA